MAAHAANVVISVRCTKQLNVKDSPDHGAPSEFFNSTKHEKVHSEK